MPQNQAQFDTMFNTLRQMGHIIERAPGNINRSIGTQHQREYFTDTPLTHEAIDSPTAAHKRHRVCHYATYERAPHKAYHVQQQNADCPLAHLEGHTHEYLDDKIEG